MLNETTINRLIDLISPDGYEDISVYELKYPMRDNLSQDAEVMRVPPSPTGFVHIGTVYASLVNERVAHQSNGVFILRIEDTDKKREVNGSVNQIINSLKDFNIHYDEGPSTDNKYGPYLQSQRRDIYLSYAMYLLKIGKAYPCFATISELQENAKRQQSERVRPGYYGKWALWRDKSDEDINLALDKDMPFVLRFRSNGNHDKRVVYTDIFKGHMEVPENDLDVPLIKSDETRLPTYHLAHVVDDYLMRVTKVFRSDEWLPSTALHIELSEALGHKPFTYGHFSPISVIDKNGGKRKLSKRKDDEADVRYWLEAGYPVESIKAYLLGLANSNFEDWYRDNPKVSVDEFPFSIKKLASSRSPLLDMAKLEDYAKDYIANLSQEEFNLNIISYSRDEFKRCLLEDNEYTNLVLSIERDGNKPRKDLAKWSQAYDQYGYFFDTLFETDFKVPGHEEYLSNFDESILSLSRQNFLSTYNPNDSQDIWFDKLKNAAKASGFATDNKLYKANPGSYEGNTADFAKIIRVSLTGKNRTPDLYLIMKVMGIERVSTRLS